MMRKLVLGSLAAILFCGHAVAEEGPAAPGKKAKVVKSAPDRVCVKANGDLDCELKTNRNKKAKNMAIDNTSRVDSLEVEKESEKQVQDSEQPEGANP